MSDLIRHFDSARDIIAAAELVRGRALARELRPSQVIEIL